MATDKALRDGIRAARPLLVSKCGRARLLRLSQSSRPASWASRRAKACQSTRRCTPSRTRWRVMLQPLVPRSSASRRSRGAARTTDRLLFRAKPLAVDLRQCVDSLLWYPRGTLRVSRFQYGDEYEEAFLSRSRRFLGLDGCLRRWPGCCSGRARARHGSGPDLFDQRRNCGPAVAADRAYCRVSSERH